MAASMTLPSSPPMLPEPEEDLIPSSPPQLPTYRMRSRKRRISESAGLSSDPLFSEDVSEAELDIGELPQRKRLIKGPWWTLSRRKSARGLRHEVGRKGLQVFDSGVWMPSDDSEQERMSVDISSDPDLPEDIQYRAIASKARIDHEQSPESLATRIVTNALENGKESIDLSGLSLRIVPNAMLRPLHQLIRQPQEHSVFRPLTPAIQLYLSGNGLTTLPTELFRFTNITVLSLRNNRLSVLPSGVFRLPQLQELNVSGNELKYLPWEALLKHCEMPTYKMTCAPNPFFTIESEHEGSNATSEHRSEVMASNRNRDDSATAYFVSSSNITYFNSHGVAIMRPLHGSTSAAPSLFELALQQAQKANALSDAVAMLPRYVPRGIINALREAAIASEVGNEKCSTCGQDFIIARAQWLEYWSDSSSLADDMRDSCLPYMRNACSFACAKPSEKGTYIVGGTRLPITKPDDGNGS